MRVFLDTNVLVAAFATRGLCADVVRLVLAEHDLITGEVVLAELAEVLSRRVKLPARAAAEILALLRAQEVVAKPAKVLQLLIRDPADRWILASAVSAKADVLVTGDDDLLAIAAAAPIKIVNPRGLWNLLRSSGSG